MSGVLERLQVVIETNLTQFKAGMATVRRHLEGLRPAIGAIGFALTAAIATGFQNIWQSANALRDVNRILQGLGYDVGDVGTRIQEMNDQLAATTRYGDVDINRAFKTLLGITQDVETAILLWGPALDLAAAQGIDVETAAMAIARYVTDGSGQLLRWYPWLKDAATEAERMELVTSDLSGIIGGAASRSADLSGAWSDLKETIGDLFKEVVPGMGDEGEGLIGLLNRLADEIRSLTDAAAGMDEINRQLLALGGISATLIGGPAALGKLAGMIGLGGLAGSLAGLGIILKPLGIILGIFGTAWILNFGGIQEKTREFWERVEPIFAELWEGLQQLWANVKGVLEPALPWIEDIFGGFVDNVLRATGTILGNLGEFVGLLNSLIEGDWKGAWDHLTGLVLGIIDLFLPGFKDAWNEAVEYLRGDFTDDLRAAVDILIRSARNWGRNLINGFISGIRSRVSAVKDAVRGVVDTVKGFLGFGSPTEEGPGAEADEWAPNLINMMADQLRAGKSTIAQAMEDVSAGLRIAPQLNGLAMAGGAGGPVIHLDIHGNTFRDRDDIDYLVDQVSRKIGGAVGRGVGNWRG